MNTILVVEDNEPVANLLAAGLRRAGHTVHVAGDAMAAMQALRFVKPDLILLDLSLPGMDGLPLLRMLRETPSGASVPVAVITASDIAAAAPEAVDLGVVSVISKHRYSLPEIVKHVGELLAA